FVALLLVLGLWKWGMPRATARASGMISDRLGVDAQIEKTELSLRGAQLLGVELRGRHGGFTARIDEIDARMNLFGALFEGARSVRAVSARGIEVAADLSHVGFEDSLAEMRRKDPRSASSTTSSGRTGKGRRYVVDGLIVRVVDADGPLITIDEINLRKEGDVVRANAESSLFGQRRSDHASIGPTKVALRRDEGDWKIDELEIEGASLRSLGNGDEERDALATRLRRALRALRSPEAPAEADSEPDAEAETETESEASGPAERSPAPTWLFSRLTSDARVVASDAQIESRTSAGHVERIRDFRWELHGGGNGWYRVTVEGQTSNDGALDVDLSVMPTEARADGTIELRDISLALIAPFAPELPLYNTEVGTLSAELDFTASSREQISIEGSLRFRELAVASARIAAEPIENINLGVLGKGIWRPEERLLQIERGRVEMGKARVLIEGELERTPEHYRVDLTAKLPPARCNDVVRAIPKGVLGSLSRFDWSGTWSSVTRISLDSRDLEATELSIRVRNLCQFERTPRWVRVERFQQPFRHRVVEPDETVFEMRTGPGTPNWVEYEDISPFMFASVISHEDGAFYEHGGFAPWAIRDALVRNLQEGRYVVGASTISMQLAKNVYLKREKTIARKVQEVLLTWWLENALNKDEILELYLNVIEYGPAVYGIRNAAAYYFGREPADLSPAETAFLACMLPSPKRYHVSYERGALTRSMKSKMRRLLEHMAKRERIGPEALAYGLAELEAFPFRRRGDPPPAPRVLPALGAPEILDPEALDPFETLFVAP
ncbi:MAG: transglycosylase domain-containing protein, partial [Polyangiales bacterium]